MRFVLLGLLCLLVAAEVQARPGGGSSFRSSGSSWSSSHSSGSSWGSSLGSSSRSSFASPPSFSRPSAPSPAAHGSLGGGRFVPRFEEIDVSYLIHRARDRQVAATTWKPGSLGPFGAGPPRPASLPIRAIEKVPFRDTLVWKLGGSLTFLVLIPLGLFWFVRTVNRRNTGWTTLVRRVFNDDFAPDAPLSGPLAPDPAAVRKELESIRDVDPDFSVVLLEDFLYALYAEAQTARGQGQLARLGPYLRPTAREQLAALGTHPVEGVVVGAMRFVSFTRFPRLGIEVEVEANYAEARATGIQGCYTLERWFLTRDRAARSRAPDKVRVLGCPACGAPLDRLLGGTCQYCGRNVDGGNLDWIVETIAVLERSDRGPMLTGTVEEQGTDRPTVVDPDLMRGLAELRAADPHFDVVAFRGRVQYIFHVMQDAWSSLQWEKARPFLSDNLFEAQRYWIAAYRAQGLRNITRNAQVTNVELARITRDRWYAAVTVRLHGASLDFTIRDSDGRLVGGDRSRIRVYTEYWTLIRGIGCTSAARGDDGCPSCGAPLELGMAARCKHCQAKVNSGEFDWVLSRIEQDEVYSG